MARNKTHFKAATKSHMLCTEAKPLREKGKAVLVTTNPAYVTCPACVTLIHQNVAALAIDHTEDAAYNRRTGKEQPLTRARVRAAAVKRGLMPWGVMVNGNVEEYFTTKKEAVALKHDLFEAMPMLKIKVVAL